MFPLDSHALAAGGQDHQPLTRPRQRPGQRRRAPEQVLAVVQHQQQPFGAQELHQLAGVLAGPGGQREHRRDRIIDAGDVADWGQLSEPRAVTEPGQHLPGGLQRQPGLAHPARTGQRYYPRPAQCGRDLLQLTLAADERAHRHRQIPGALGNSADRRELGRQAGVGQLIDQLRLAQITQPELPQPLQAKTPAQMAFHQGTCGLGDQHLPPVPGGFHPGAPVDRRMIHTATAAHPRLAGMQPHPHPQHGTGRPPLPGQAQLARASRLHRGNRPGENGEKTVTLATGGHHYSPMIFDHAGE